MTRRLVLFHFLGMTLATLSAAAGGADLDPGEAEEIAVEAYTYAYPLVLMDVSRRVMTNVAAATPGGPAPMNQFRHRRTFPDATYTDVVRPNADTLYSTLWFDVTGEPLVIRLPDSGGRYYLLQMLDLWTDVFACPGKRTTGTGPQVYAVVGPRWEGKLPDGVEMIRAPTGTGWMIGRTQTNGPGDFAYVHKFQAGITATPLSAWGRDYTPPRGKVDPSVAKDPPVEQVAKMGAAEFFTRFADLTKDNPPHGNDYPVLARLRRLGLEPGRPFHLAGQPPAARAALEKAPGVARRKIAAEFRHAGVSVNNWRTVTAPIGTYGTAYLRRAGVAFAALGANVSEDATYPTAFADSEGRPFDSAKRYEMHFAKGQLPPVRAFWSLTMYNDRQYFAANPINRYAIGDRDRLKLSGDGSLTLYIQRKSPGKEREGNWLPAPKEGGFSMNLRLYWPGPAALDGTWAPPAVKRID
jgi:hypothetical protein